MELPAGEELQLRARDGARRPRLGEHRPARIRRQRQAGVGQGHVHRLAGRHRAPDRRAAEGRDLHRDGRHAAQVQAGGARRATPPPGQIAITEAYSYRDLRALVVVGFSFSNLPARQRRVRVPAHRLRQGRRPVRRADRLRVLRPHRRRASAARCSAARPKAVQDAAVTLHYPDPCGDNYSLIDTIQRQAANVGKVKVPVLVACGRNDVLYAPFGCEAQADRFAKGSVADPQEHRPRGAAGAHGEDLPQAPFPLPRALRSLGSSTASDSRSHLLDGQIPTQGTGTRARARDRRPVLDRLRERGLVDLLRARPGGRVRAGHDAGRLPDRRRACS